MSFRVGRMEDRDVSTEVVAITETRKGIRCVRRWISLRFNQIHHNVQ